MLDVIRNMQNRKFVEVAGKQIPLPKTLGYHNQGVMATSSMYGSSSLDENPACNPMIKNSCFCYFISNLIFGFVENLSNQPSVG